MIYLIILLIFCAIFVSSEIVFISSNYIKLYIDSKEQEKFIATSLVGTNICIIGFSILMEKRLQIKLPAVYITFIATIIIFIFGEIIPKAIGIKFNEIIAKALLKPYNIFYFLFYPIIFLVRQTSYFILNILGTGEKIKKITQQEIKIASKMLLSLRIRVIIHRLFKLRNKSIKNILTTNVKINLQAAKYKIIKEDASMEELFEQIHNGNGFFVVKNEKDEITGIITKKNIIKELLGNV